MAKKIILKLLDLIKISENGTVFSEMKCPCDPNILSSKPCLSKMSSQKLLRIIQEPNKPSFNSRKTKLSQKLQSLKNVKKIFFESKGLKYSFIRLKKVDLRTCHTCSKFPLKC
jgi:hypothetical protein